MINELLKDFLYYCSSLMMAYGVIKDWLCKNWM